MSKEFIDLPEWLKKLWDLNPSIAREAELTINKLESEIDRYKAYFEGLCE